MHVLKRERLEHGMSLSQLSAATGLSIATLARAESGWRVSELTTFKIAKALDRDPEELITVLAEESSS